MMVSGDNFIAEGSWVLLVLDRGRRWVVRVERGRRFVCDKGYVDLDSLIGLQYGSAVRLSSGVDAYVYRPTLIDFIDKVFIRKSQIIYPKDASYIVANLGLRSGMKVLEVGLGSGAMTTYLVNAIYPGGVVYSYEVRRDMIEIASRNLAVVGFLDYVVIRNKDASQGIDESGFDAAFIDVGDPWRVADHVYDSLKPGSIAGFFMPTFNQVDRLATYLRSHGGWGDVRVVELFERGYEVRENALRPSTRMVGHTGFIMFARKRLRE